MRYIGFEREEEAELWAREKMGIDCEPDFFRAMAAVDERNDFVCVVILTNFTSRNVDINIAMDGAKMRPKGTIEMYNAVFGFLFDQLHLPRVTGLVGSKNIKAQRVDVKFGFKLEGVVRKGLSDDEDLLIYGFLPEEFHQHAWYKG